MEVADQYYTCICIIPAFRHMIGSGNGGAEGGCRIGTILCRDNILTEQRRDAIDETGQNL